jgi:hypothetical protein
MPRVLQSFTRSSKNLLTAFHKEVEARSMKAGAGSAGIALLGHQLRNYEGIFRQLTTQMMEVINNLQREANREFTPVIARSLSTAYDWCANESGMITGPFSSIVINNPCRSRSIRKNEELHGHSC